MFVPPALSGLPASLWSRIETHSFESDGLQNFTSRLAQEQCWSLAFARGAVAEYRRFCFLAVSGAQPVTPSVEVDEVWHLHLIHSRDYWDVWCAEVLRAPLHHNPTPGGAAALAQYRAQYAQTLLEYEQIFGAPPEAYWPATHRRFGRQPRWRRPLHWRAITKPWGRA